MNLRQCSLCGIKWINDVPYWSHGNKPTTNANVAAIVCKHAKPRSGASCANPCGGDTSEATDTWEGRMASAQQLETSLQRVVPPDGDAPDNSLESIKERYKDFF